VQNGPLQNRFQFVCGRQQRKFHESLFNLKISRKATLIARFACTPKIKGRHSFIAAAAVVVNEGEGCGIFLRKVRRQIKLDV